MPVEVLGTPIDAFLFDLDGVVTRTARVHARAWKRLFDEFLASLEGDPERLAPFRLPADYLAYVDGKPVTRACARSCNRAPSTCRGVIPRTPRTPGPSAAWAIARTATSMRCWRSRGWRCSLPRSP